MATYSIWKFRKTTIYLQSWLPTGTYHENLAIWDFFSFEILWICIIFPWKFVCTTGQNQVKIWQLFFPNKKKTDPFSIYVPVSKGSRVFFSISWCSQTGDHPQEDSAKFGYRPGMKVKRIKILHISGYILEPNKEIWDRFSKKKAKNLATRKPKKRIFSHVGKK